MQDPYKLLNIERSASQEDVKRAYRKLAKELHPDINPGNTAVEQKFKEISQAYSILGDPEKRKRFDRGEIDASGQETPWKGGFYRNHAGTRRGEKYSTFEFGDDVSADDIFADLFGSRTRRVRRPGANVSYTVPITFLDAVKGAKKRIKLADGKTLDVRIPPGTEDRQTLRLKGQGMPGVGGGPAGDALVEVQIEPHPFFERRGSNVHVELPVTLQEALLGATVTVPTVHGSVSMKIPAGSNSGSTLRLKGKGLPAREGGETGDQYVKLRVMLPERPDQELREFIENWSRSHDYDPRRKAGMT
jgi:DnaJ-class molecular chaperone